MAQKIQLKRGQSANLGTLTLDAGEPAFTLDTKKLYIGDGTNKVLINPDQANAETATKLQTPRNISLSGDATGSTSFDGSADKAIPVTLANSGVTAGTYPKVTVDSKGRVTGGAALAATDIPNLTLSKITDANTKEDKANKGVANGYADLDANGKIPLSRLDDALLGNVKFKGLWNASTNTPNLPATPTTMGHYYIVTTKGTQFGISFDIGDWVIAQNDSWGKVQNTDAVASVNGMTGAVNVVNITGNAGTADKLKTPRTLSASGDATGSASFDGSANATIALTLAASGVTAGTHTKVTVDSKGRVTGGAALAAADVPSLDWTKISSGKPTTLAGYGITDAVGASSVIDGGTF